MVYCGAVLSAILATAWLLVDWSTRVTDGQTDRRAIAYSALSIAIRSVRVYHVSYPTIA